MVPNAMQPMIDALRASLQKRWSCQSLSLALNPVLSPQQLYANTCMPPHAAEQSYQKNFVSPAWVLRRQVADSMPTVLRTLAIEPPDDLLLVCAGPAYPDQKLCHELEFWRLLSHDPGLGCLEDILDILPAVLSKGLRLRLKPAQKAHLVYAQRIEAYTRLGWTRLGYCGVISPLLLIEMGLDAATGHGIAVTLDLDRCLALPASAAEEPKRLQDHYL